MGEKHTVFVYGTLRSAAVNPKLYKVYGLGLYDLGAFPVAAINRYESIVGNIIEVDDKELALLDNYENLENGLYVRDTVDVFDDETKELAYKQAWCYLCGPTLGKIIKKAKLIVSGNWDDRIEALGRPKE